MAAYGVPEADISRVVGIDPKTLRKYYRDELDLGEVKANAQVAGFLFNSAKNGNVSAQIFWLKTRARWKEPAAEHRHVAQVTNMVELSNVPHEDLRHLEEIFALLTPRDQEILDALNAEPNPQTTAYLPAPAQR
jgi:hypothetical protein